jgi:glycosyltransferase involved in cell wall biosynthesis
MRIAIVTWTRRKAGGVETYLDGLLTALGRAGHQTALFCEVDLPADRPPVSTDDEAAVWCISRIGLDKAVDSLLGWHPDVIYGHGLSDPGVEARTLYAAPAVLFAHGYRGICISGEKSFKYPEVRPCGRRFGWQCLMHFYPHRCGGLNPATMWRDFNRESRRLAISHSYRAIVTGSSHMREEYIKHRFSPQAVRLIRLPVENGASAAACGINASVEANTNRGRVAGGTLRLAFVGRMELVKGGGKLLDALPLVLDELGRPLQVIFVGEGRERSRWERQAVRMQSYQPRLEIQFKGWLEMEELRPLLCDSDLLVVPSLWPEPFGLIGPQAGSCGLPAAAFDVGGIGDWLTAGVNGHLAPGDPPSAEGLARAITRCLKDPADHQRLRKGASNLARRFSLAAHVTDLLGLFAEVSRP